MSLLHLSEVPRLDSEHTDELLLRKIYQSDFLWNKNKNTAKDLEFKGVYN